MVKVSEAGRTVLEDTVVPAARHGVRASPRAKCCASSTSRAGRPSTSSVTTPTIAPSATTAANTVKLNKHAYLGEGSVLWSGHARRMMTIIEDTCGLHDTLLGCCSARSTRSATASPIRPAARRISSMSSRATGSAHRHRAQHQFLHVRAVRAGRRGFDRRRALEARRPSRPPGRDGRARRHLQLPAALQPRRRFRADPGSRHHLRGAG